ncbi:VapD family protein [Intestinimonas massiliensis (ex Afouda et al. 2020)]|uniref:VapD family protein n=1 Tax=Intestinimonas massiliensis (ex Afouda et al. 2020) TaxID=1673721 RepID=UPI00103145EF|nr:VapD family protein [Intestinimonas massiliensis (ex Afouda et al. 2020)]
MAGSGSRKQITFDLHQESLKRYYPHPEPVRNEQYYKRAYHDIQQFMHMNGFERRQHSVYVSINKVTTLDIVGLMEQLAEALPWLSQCVREVDMSTVGARHSLKRTLQAASGALAVELDGPAIQARSRPEPQATPEQQRKRKRVRSQER